MKGRFHIIEQVGSGSYGFVYKAYDTIDNKIVAIKVLKSSDPSEGIPISFMREIKALSSLCDPCIIQLRKVFREGKKVFFTMDYCETDLAKQMAVQKSFTIAQIKSIMFQLLSALRSIHKIGFAHRDIKPSNLLLSGGTNLKVADFGLSCSVNSSRLSPHVSALAYRAPELILGSQNYSTSIDIWSAGVVFYELVTGESPPSSSSEIGQLNNIFSICGSPDENSPLLHLPHSKMATLLMIYPRTIDDFLRSKVPYELHSAIPLITSMLAIEPSKRPTACDLLENDFFNNIDEMEPLLVPEISDVLENSSPRLPLIRPSPILIEVA